MDYPPFSELLLINLSSENEKSLKVFSNKLHIIIKESFEECNDIYVYEACPCPIGKINNIYRWQILIKGKLNDIITNKIKKIVYENTKDIYNEIKVTLDVNPNSLM